MKEFKNFRTKQMSIKVRCACVSNEYFTNNLRDYYEFISLDFFESKVHGFYRKTFYKLRSYSECIDLGISSDKYSEMPAYICTSILY